MKTYTIAIALLFTLFAVSCNYFSNNDAPTQELGIELDNGAKWKVNEEMIPFVHNAEAILGQYKGGDYKKLAEQLANENKKLINSCTMKGKSHDELHKWLHPHLELVKDLKK